MKFKTNLFVVFALGTLGTLPTFAAPIWKAGSTGDLNLTTSWFTTQAGPANPGAIAPTNTLRFGGTGQSASIAAIQLGGDMTAGALRLDNETGTPNYNVVIAAGNTLTLNGNNDYNPGYVSGIVLNSSTGGTLTVNADIDIAANQRWVASRNLNVGGNVGLGTNTLTLWTAGGTTTISGVISGTGGITRAISAGGISLLSGANTYSGATTLNLGTLRAGVASVTGVSGAFGVNSAVIMSNVAATNLDLNGFNNQIGSITGGGSTGGNVLLGAAILTTGGDNSSPAAFAGSISGTGGGVTKIGSGKQIFSGSTTYNGATTISEGTLKFGGGSNIASSGISIASAATLEWAPTVSNVTFAGSLSGSGKVLRSTSAGSNATFTGNNSSFTGSWEITGGYVGLANDASVGASGVGMTLDGGGIFFATTGQTLSASRTVTLGAGGGTLNGGTGSTYDFAAKFTGIGDLTKVSGATAILSGDNDYTGNTIISTGTLEIGGSGRLGNGSYAGTISIGGGGPSLAVNSTADQTLSGVISGGGTLTKDNTGTLTLSAVNTYTGITTVTAGELVINGSLASSTVNVGANGILSGIGVLAGAVNVTGVLAPGASVATFATGNLSFTTGSTFAYELDSTVGLGSAADLQLVRGTLNLTGIVNLTLADLASGGPAAAFADNTVFTLINYTGVWNSGTFSFGGNALANGDTFTAGLNTWRIDYDAASGGSNFSSEQVVGNFVNLTAIPEPSAALLGGLGLLALLRRRRNH